MARGESSNSLANREIIFPQGSDNAAVMHGGRPAARVRIEPHFRGDDASPAMILLQHFRPLNLRHLPLVLLGAASLHVGVASATDFCVDTGHELEAAIEAAATNGQDDEIRIASKVIKGSTNLPPNARWPYQPGESDQFTQLLISGGWSPASTCDQQELQPDATQIDAEYAAQAFLIQPTIQPWGGRVSISNLLITRGFLNSNQGAAVLFSATGPGARFTLERTVIVASKAQNAASNIVAASLGLGGQVRLLNNAVFSNTVLRSGGSVVSVSCDQISTCYVTNNSIYENYLTDNANHYGLALSGVVTASNNAVADNTLGDASHSGDEAGPIVNQQWITLRNNHFESEGFGAVYAESGTTTGDPKWTQAFLYMYPNPDSPLRNSGSNLPAGGLTSYDIDGDPRIQQSVVDRGAIEMPPPANAPPTIQAPASVTISEFLTVGGTIVTSTANDDGKPSPLSYSLVPKGCSPYGNGTAFMSINASGVVTLSAPIPEHIISCVVGLVVNDGEYTASTDVLVKVNRAPSMGNNVLNVSSNLAVGTKAWVFNADDDNLPTPAPLTFSLLAVQVQPAGPNPFLLASNGDLTLQQALPTQATTYTFSVKACDSMPLCGTGSLVVNVEPESVPPGQGPVFANGFE